MSAFDPLQTLEPANCSLEDAVPTFHLIGKIAAMLTMTRDG